MSDKKYKKTLSEKDLLSNIFDSWHPDNVAEPNWGIQVGRQKMLVHKETECAGRNCVIHNPSNHHMVNWPTNFRADKYLTERTCPHGIGHPDPDDMIYHRQKGNEWKGIHGCCGCCIQTTNIVED